MGDSDRKSGCIRDAVEIYARVRVGGAGEDVVQDWGRSVALDVIVRRFGRVRTDAKLLDAAQKNNGDDVRALLAAGADANARAADGSTPLVYAAHFGDVVSVRALLGAKADP